MAARGKLTGAFLNRSPLAGFVPLGDSFSFFAVLRLLNLFRFLLQAGRKSLAPSGKSIRCQLCLC
jgi:hypothetical protein